MSKGGGEKKAKYFAFWGFAQISIIDLHYVAVSCPVHKITFVPVSSLLRHFYATESRSKVGFSILLVRCMVVVSLTCTGRIVCNTCKTYAPRLAPISFMFMLGRSLIGDWNLIDAGSFQNGLCINMYCAIRPQYRYGMTWDIVVGLQSSLDPFMHVHFPLSPFLIRVHFF